MRRIVILGGGASGVLLALRLLRPAPTSTRTNTSRLPPSASPGSPASPARPGSPWCWRAKPPSSSTAATPVQIRQQIDTGVFTPESLIDHPPEAWLGERHTDGQRIGFDPWLHTPAQVERLTRAVEAAGARLVAVDGNPIDAVWPDRPAMPKGAVTLHPEHLAGLDRVAKLVAVRDKLGDGETLLVSDPHAVAWLFNMRGADVGHTPLLMSYALVPKSGRPTLYVDGAKLSNSVRDTLEGSAEVADPAGLPAALEGLGREGRSLRFDAATVPHRLVEALKAAGGRAEVGADPIALMKASKSEAERQGARDAHRRATPPPSRASSIGSPRRRRREGRRRSPARRRSKASVGTPAR